MYVALPEQIPVVRQPLTPPLIQKVATCQAFKPNHKEKKQDKADYTRRINTPQELWRRFVSQDAAILHQDEIGSPPHLISIIEPTGAYSDGAMLIVAVPPEIIDPEDNKTPIKALTIYDLPEEVQAAYFYYALKAAKSMRSSWPKEPKPQVFFTENVSPQVSNQQYSVGRTVALPHIQVWGVIPTTEDNQDQPQFHPSLKHERRLIKLFHRIIKTKLEMFMNKNLQETLNTQLAVSTRLASPYGYEFSLTFPENMSLQEQGKIIAHFMRMHHHTYADVASELLTQLKEKVQTNNVRLTKSMLYKTIRPQPAYKVVGRYSAPHTVVISITPNIVSSAGVMEVMGIQLHRDPKHETMLSPEQNELYYLQVRQHLTSGSN